MITNTTSKSTYVITDGVYAYAVGFQYNKNPDNTPQIKVYLNKLSNTPLVYGVDYTLSEDGLSVVLSAITPGDRLDIIRDIPMVQLSDYVIGRIDPEQIENDFDESVMRDQQLQANIDFFGKVPEDHEARIQECESDIDNIESFIPNQTTSENQLADKDFVNSSIATSTATFRGTYSTLAELEAVTADDNDYGFVEFVDAVGNTLYSRYKYSNGSWAFEYNLNNSSFTAAQWAAINSGITAGIVNTFSATGHNVGDVFFTMRNDNELNGAVACDGSQYNTTDFSGGQSIGALLEAGKVPYVSLSQYTTLLSTNGSVGVFGWDGVGTTTFRVPSLNDIFIETGTAAQIGDFIPAGTPNITGKFSVTNSASGPKGNINATDGCVYADGTTSGAYSAFASDANSSSGPKVAHIDASRSSSVYGNSNTVQPKSVRYRAMVQLAISATDQALETCTGVLADVAALKYDYVVDFQAPTAANNYTWYRKYKSGWVEQGGRIEVNTTSVTMPVEMSDSDYQAIITYRNMSGNTNTTKFENIATLTQTTTGFTVSSASTSYRNWQVSGMAA